MVFKMLEELTVMILNCGLFACFYIKLLSNNSKVLPVILSCNSWWIFPVYNDGEGSYDL